MRILLDENIPVDLAADLVGHRVDTVVGLGWAGVTNGRLLRRAEGRYDAFITMDRNLKFQQNLTALSIGIVVLCAASNRIAHLQPLIPALLGSPSTLKPGQLQQLGSV